MGTYNSAIPTNAGLALIAQSISGGQSVTFTKLRTSSYQYPSGTDYASLTSLLNIQQTEDITYASITDKKTVKVNATVTNAGVSAAYTIRNLGIYAKVGSGAETLFAVVPAVVGDTVPVYSDTTRVSYIFSITIAIGSATGFTVNVTTAGMASVVDVDTAMEIVADTFDVSTAYTAGEYVRHNGTLYRFTADHQAGAWVGTDAVTVSIGEDLGAMGFTVVSGQLCVTYDA